MRKTKWVDHQFSEEERRAQKMWQSAQKDYNRLCEGLRTPPDSRSRERLHERLDYVLDRIEKRRAEAKELFPEVADSSTIAEWTVRI